MPSQPCRDRSHPHADPGGVGIALGRCGAGRRRQGGHRSDPAARSAGSYGGDPGARVFPRLHAARVGGPRQGGDGVEPRRRGAGRPPAGRRGSGRTAGRAGGAAAHPRHRPAPAARERDALADRPGHARGDPVARRVGGGATARRARRQRRDGQHGRGFGDRRDRRHACGRARRRRETGPPAERGGGGFFRGWGVALLAGSRRAGVCLEAGESVGGRRTRRPGGRAVWAEACRCGVAAATPGDASARRRTGRRRPPGARSAGGCENARVAHRDRRSPGAESTAPA